MNNWLRRLAIVVIGALIMIPAASAAIVFQSSFQPDTTTTPPEPVDKGCVGNVPFGYACVQTPNSFTLQQWTVSVGNIDWVLPALWNPAVVGGTSIDLDGNTQGAIFANFSGLTAGQVYSVTIQYSGNPGDNGSFTGANDKTFTAAVQDAAQTTTWGSQAFTFDAKTNASLSNLTYATGSFNFVAAASTASILLTSNTPGAWGSVIGQVVIGDVPEPGTCFMIGSGLIGLVWLRRRS